MTAVENQVNNDLIQVINEMTNQATILHLERDILALHLEIRDLKKELYGDSGTEKTKG